VLVQRDADERQDVQFARLKTAIHGSYKRAAIDEEASQRAARETPQAAQRNLGAVMLCELSCAVFPGIKDLLACEDREKPVTI
jgi:hypothetical protein